MPRSGQALILLRTLRAEVGTIVGLRRIGVVALASAVAGVTTEPLS